MIQPSSDIQANWDFLRQYGVTTGERYAIETMAPVIVNAGDRRPELLRQFYNSVIGACKEADVNEADVLHEVGEFFLGL